MATPTSDGGSGDGLSKIGAGFCGREPALIYDGSNIRILI